MRLGDRLGPLGEQPRRPQLVAQIVPGGLQLVGHAAVEDDRAGGEGFGEGGMVAGHASTVVDERRRPGRIVSST